MKINIENVNNFFKKNGKKWVCTTLTALMLSAPAISKSENNTGGDKSKSIEQSYSIDLNEEKNIIDVTDLITDDFDESVANIKDEMRNILQGEDSVTLKCYGPWKEDYVNYVGGKYVRTVMIIKPNCEYFRDHSYEQFLFDLQHGNTDGIMEIISSSVETSNYKPEDYYLISCEIVDTNTIIKIRYVEDWEIVVFFLFILCAGCVLVVAPVAAMCMYMEDHVHNK